LNKESIVRTGGENPKKIVKFNSELLQQGDFLIKD